jgi:hypothetical protein
LLVEIRLGEGSDRPTIARYPDEPGGCWNVLDGDNLSIRSRVGCAQPRAVGEPYFGAAPPNIQIVSDVVRIKKLRL